MCRGKVPPAAPRGQDGAMAAPPIAGVLETAIYVADLPRARAFYEDVLGLSPMFTDARLARIVDTATNNRHFDLPEF